MRALPFAFRKAPAGGGGVPAWDYSVSQASATSSEQMNSYTVQLGKITASKSGTVNNIGFLVYSQNYPGQHTKHGIYDASKNLLSQGITTNVGPFIICSITPLAVTMGTVYFVGPIPEADNFGDISKHPSDANGYVYSSASYATAMPSTVSGSPALTYCVGMEIT